MSLTGNDPHTKYVEKEKDNSEEAVAKSGQWQILRQLGFKIDIHCVYGTMKYEAFVKADELEAYFKSRGYVADNHQPDISGDCEGVTVELIDVRKQTGGI